MPLIANPDLVVGNEVEGLAVGVPLSTALIAPPTGKQLVKIGAGGRNFPECAADGKTGWSCHQVTIEESGPNRRSKPVYERPIHRSEPRGGRHLLWSRPRTFHRVTRRRLLPWQGSGRSRRVFARSKRYARWSWLR